MRHQQPHEPLPSECGDTNQGFSEADQIKYAGEPIDLAIDALLKAGQFENAAQRRIYSEIPSFEDYGLGLKDVPTMRIMPVENIESKGIPTFPVR